MKSNDKDNSSKPIGIFDSGIGGLTVLRQIEKIMPNENIVYFGDTARVPYGNKSASTVKKFSTENILFLLEQNVKMIVVACNTSSALACDFLKNTFRIPIIGVIDAGASRALEVTSGKIGVIGTKSTTKSKSFQKAIFAKRKKVSVYEKSCPLFVPLIEEGPAKKEIIIPVAKMYLNEFKKKRIDTLILGCTHYPLLRKEIESFLPGVNIIDSGEAVAWRSLEVLERLRIRRKGRKKGSRQFFVSDEAAGFARLAQLFLKYPIPKPRVISV